MEERHQEAMKGALAAAQTLHAEQVQGLEREIEALNMQLHTTMHDNSSHHSELSLSLVKMRTLHDNEKLEWQRSTVLAREQEEERHRDAIEVIRGRGFAMAMAMIISYRLLSSFLASLLNI